MKGEPISCSTLLRTDIYTYNDDQDNYEKRKKLIKNSHFQCCMNFPWWMTDVSSSETDLYIRLWWFPVQIRLHWCFSDTFTRKLTKNVTFCNETKSCNAFFCVIERCHYLLLLWSHNLEQKPSRQWIKFHFFPLIKS